MKNMPRAIAVRDIVFQPQTNDLLIATHGRSLFVMDDAAFLAGVARAKGDELFAVGPALRHAVRATRFGFGDGNFVGPNPAYGAVITFALAADAAAAKVEISDGMGDVIRSLPVTAHAGVNRVVWDLRYGAEKGRGPQALPGNYVARLRVGDKVWEQKFKVELDPGSPATAEQLRAQFAMLREILGMQAGVNDAEKKLRATTDVQAKALLGQLRRAGGRSASGPRLRENLDALFNMVDGADAAPTEAQSKYFDELRGQFEGLMKQTETLATNR
jgi:hypothetical protein